MKEISFDPAALDEISEAAVWYKEQRPGLEGRFLDEIDRCHAAIRERPRAFPPLLSTRPDLRLRRALLRQFPYELVYLEMDEEIRILAVAHSRRRPGNWSDRLAEP